MEVKGGCKQTKVGAIPQSWDVLQLAELGTWKGGMTPSMQNPDFWQNGDVPWISSGDVKSVLLKETGYSITSLAVKEGKTTLLPAKSIVVVTRSGILRKYLPVAMNVVPMAINQDIKALIPTDKISPDFLLHALIDNGPRILSRCLKAGTTVESVEYKWLKAFTISIPPLFEQRAIAGALSDVDALIGALDAALAKKRDLKQAAMQQLLTGQKRLPGFHGKWEMTRLGELGSTFGGLTGKMKSDFGNGSARYITFMNIMSNVVIDCDMFEHVRISPTESQNRVMKGDLFFNGSSETPDEVGMCAVLKQDVQDVFLNSFCFGFRFRSGAEADGLFLAYYFRSSEGRELLKSLAQGAIRYNLSKTAFLKVSFAFPQLREQTAITEVLSDMDTEIAALEQRRDKTRALKQGMMQELLTGRIRLI